MQYVYIIKCDLKYWCKIEKMNLLQYTVHNELIMQHTYSV